MTSGVSEDRDGTATAPLLSGDVAVPSRAGRFVVHHLIGAGSTGVVAAAYDPVLDRRIALKVLRMGETPASEARLILEAQAMARLVHPSVVTVHEAGVAEGRVYLAMEFIGGGTLRAWLAAAPRTTPVAGTPHYMAPEQHAGHSGTRTHSPHRSHWQGRVP